MKTTTRKQADKIKAALNRYFKRRSCHQTSNAQQNLQSVGSHFVDAETLKFFAARVLESRNIAHGLLFAVRSTARDNGNGRHKINVFNLFGHSIADFTATTAKAVKKDFNEWAKTFDVGAHYKEHGTEYAKRLRRKASDLSKALR